MESNLGEIICACRKKKHISQRQLASMLSNRGIKITNQAVSKWESGASLPSAAQFLLICDVLDIVDISGIFLGKSYDLMAGLNEEGRARVFEYADMLRDSDKFDDPGFSGPRGTRVRTLPVYDLNAANGRGKLLDLPDYKPMQVGSEVPLSANFGVVIAGDSMEPDFHDGQIVWMHQQSRLAHGDIGVFLYEGVPYFKRLRDRVGGTRLQSVDSHFPDIIISDPGALVTLGKVAE